MFPSLLEDMMNGRRRDDEYDGEDHFSSGSSSSSSIINSSSRSITPLSDSSNDASYDAGRLSDDQED